LSPLRRCLPTSSTAPRSMPHRGSVPSQRFVDGGLPLSCGRPGSEGRGRGASLGGGGGRRRGGQRPGLGENGAGASRRRWGRNRHGNRAHQAASQATPHGTTLPLLALGRADAPDAWPARRHPRACPPCPCPMRLRRARRPLRGTHEAALSGARPREHRALPPPPEPVDRAAGPGRGAAAAYFRSVTRLRPSPQVELFEYCGCVAAKAKWHLE
jgi:hypothetical protein